MKHCFESSQAPSTVENDLLNIDQGTQLAHVTTKLGSNDVIPNQIQTIGVVLTAFASKDQTKLGRSSALGLKDVKRVQSAAKHKIATKLKILPWQSQVVTKI